MKLTGLVDSCGPQHWQISSWLHCFPTGQVRSVGREGQEVFGNLLLSGKWTEEEEKRLAEVVHELTSTEPGDTVTQGVSWAAVAERVGTRSEKQCRSKWLNYLNWKQSGGTEWTKEDEISLILRCVLSSMGHLFLCV